jgi:diacylglycerol O-acyltransferase / wax synthase
MVPMAARLSGADALSLHTQSLRSPAHTLTVAIINASDQLSHQRLHRLVAESLPRLARFRSRLVPKPLGVGQPLWAEIDNYDPSSQIHCLTVPPPGGPRELADLIADLSTRRPDCRKQLWEAWSIDGLTADRWALAVKTSPALNDGAAGAASLWPRLLTTGPRTNSAHRLPFEPSLGSAPSVGELVTDAVIEVAENQFTGVWLMAEALSGVLQTVRGRLHRKRERKPTPSSASRISGPVPHTVFNAPLTRRRAVAFTSISLADVKAVSDAFGGSITNVLVAASALSLRAWLQRHDKVPDSPLLMRMPFELPVTDRRRTAKTSTIGRLRIPVHLDDPVQVLANLHTATERLNSIMEGSSETAYPPIDLEAMASLLPPTVAHVGMLLFTRSGLRHQLMPVCHGSVSSTAVEPVPAYCAGGKVVGIHTVAPLSEESGLNIAFVSRGEELDVSVCVCPDNVPAVEDIATGIAHSVDILMAAARKSPRGQGRSVVTEMTTHPANRSRGKPY